MRLVSTISEENQARLLSDYLLSIGIDNRVMMNGSSSWDLWVINEDNLERAHKILEDFQANPESPEFKKASKSARKIRNEKKKEKSKTRYIDVRTQVFYKGLVPHGRFTLGIIGISVLMTLVTNFGTDMSLLNHFLITKVLAQQGYITWHKGFTEILNGEIWRLITPIFLHFGVLHLLFNMLWLNDLGSQVEEFRGRFFLVAFIIVIAILSNIGQYFASGPLFGGMSGIVYGLLGYIWMMGKYDPLSKMGLDRTTVTMMIAWFFLCLTGFIGNVANTAHAVGLLLGVSWGYIESGQFRRKMVLWLKR